MPQGKLKIEEFLERGCGKQEIICFFYVCVCVCAGRRKLDGDYVHKRKWLKVSESVRRRKSEAAIRLVGTIARPMLILIYGCLQKHKEF